MSSTYLRGRKMIKLSITVDENTKSDNFKIIKGKLLFYI